MSKDIKYWVMPSDPNRSDEEKEFKENNNLTEYNCGRHQKIKIDDIVYLYISAPIQAIRFKTKVVSMVENKLTLKLIKKLKSEKSQFQTFTRTWIARTPTKKSRNQRSIT